MIECKTVRNSKKDQPFMSWDKNQRHESEKESRRAFRYFFFHPRASYFLGQFVGPSVVPLCISTSSIPDTILEISIFEKKKQKRKRKRKEPRPRMTKESESARLEVVNCESNLANRPRDTVVLRGWAQTMVINEETMNNGSSSPSSVAEWEYV